MSVALKPGQTLTENDLKIIIRNASGVPVDPFYIRYSLFDYTTGLEVLSGDADRIPATTGVGQYYVPATLPLDSNIGSWLVRWNFRETVSSPLVQVVQEFAVVQTDTIVSSTGSEKIDTLLRRLRITLRDNNPDRNYRFRPPAHEKFLQAQTQVFGYIWEDYELVEWLNMAMDDFNLAPPVTGSTIETIPDRWRSLVVIRAAYYACAALATNWIADEFSIKGTEHVTVRTKDGEEFSLTVEELFSVIYDDKLREICRSVKEEHEKAMKEIEAMND